MPAFDNPSTAVPLKVSRSSVQMLVDQSWSWLLSHYLQIVIAMAIGAALVALMWGVRMLGTRLCRRHYAANHWPLTIGRVFAATRFWFMLAFAAKLVAGYASPPPLVNQTILVVFTITSAMQGALWVREFILGIVEHRAGGDDHGTWSSAVGIIRLLVTFTLFAIATILILDNLGVNVTGLVAGLGIGGIAIGLAAKGIFDDLFSALSIIFDRPFQRGDTIKWDKTIGSVEAIGLKSTRLRSVNGEEVVISNTNLLNKELHNLARTPRRRVEFALHVVYFTPASVLARVPEIIKALVEATDKCSLARCGINDLGAPAIELLVQFDVQTSSAAEAFEARNAVALAILAAFEKEGIEFAGPDGNSISLPTGQTLPGAAGDAEEEIASLS
jgi:small-conductance mechanosensitive channel